MSATTTAFVTSLLERFPFLLPLYEEHLEDFDEILPHVFFGSLTRWLLQECDDLDKRSAEVPQIIAFFNDAYNSGDGDIKELLIASFLENILGAPELDHGLKELLGPGLSDALAKLSVNSSGA